MSGACSALAGGIEEGVEISFQIEEVIHQDVDGIVCRAVNLADQRTIEIRRFFLPEAQIGRLRSEKEAGESSLFERGLAHLMELEIPHLREVLGGGFDEVDGTPYLALAWNDGETLEQARDRGHLQAADAETFRQQVGDMLALLLADMRGTLLLESREIKVSRSMSGALESSFLLSPRHYFGALGGAPSRSSSHEQALAGLVALFPKGSRLAVASSHGGSGHHSAIAPKNATPQLKSMKKGAGRGLLWAVLGITLLVGGGIAGSLYRSISAEPEAQEVQVEEAEPIDDPVGEQVTPESFQIEKIEPDPIPKEPVHELALIVPDFVEKVAPEPKPTPDLDEVEAEAVEEILETGAEKIPEYGPYELRGRTELEGKRVTLAGPVMDVAQSTSGKWWYFDFGGKSRSAYVVFKGGMNVPSITFADWEGFVGQDVRVTGEFRVLTGHGKFGSKSVLEIEGLQAIEVILPPRVYTSEDWSELSEQVGSGEEVLFGATYKELRVQGGEVYLFFQEGFEVAARFAAGGPLSNNDFKDKLAALEGQPVRISAPVKNGPEGKIKYVLELRQADDITAAPSD